ncbi:MAG TPA: hypothetical protein VFD58_17975 [Blastocatellia bacterium]|nr:hypothetical protein [Blastocatellia bacterium]
MLNCPACSYESPESARFCRQCGAPLPAEGDLKEAETRNIGRQGPVVATAGSAPLPPSIGDSFAGNTARYQQPIPQPAYQAPAWTLPAANTASLRSKKRRVLKWGGFALALLISGGIGAGINEESNRNRIFISQPDRIRLERLRTQDQIDQALFGSVTEQQERRREEAQQKLEQIERAREDAERDIERGAGAASDEQPLDLTEYEYPNAATGQFSRIPRRELRTQRATDNFETVTQFYQKKFGKPFVLINERNEKKALFQSSGTPSVTVLVREGRDRSRAGTEISILRSPFRFPQPQSDQTKPKTEESQPPAAKPAQKTAP